MYIDQNGNVSTIKREDGEDKIYGEENTSSLEKKNTYQKTLTLTNQINIAS